MFFKEYLIDLFCLFQYEEKEKIQIKPLELDLKKKKRIVTIGRIFVYLIFSFVIQTDSLTEKSILFFLYAYQTNDNSFCVFFKEIHAEIENKIILQIE